MSRIRVLAFMVYREHSVSFYRGLGPLLKLRKLGLDLDILEVPPDVAWRDMKWCDFEGIDAAFMLRPFDENQKACAMRIKDMGIPLWIDHDDDTFLVPHSNPGFQGFNNDTVRNATAATLRLADVVTVSTEPLKRMFSVYNDNIVVIPNALDDNLARYAQHHQQRDGKVVTWRGSNTHDGDVREYESEIIRVAEQFKNEKVYWDFIGDYPWYLLDHLPVGSARVVGWDNVTDYMKLMMQNKTDVMMVPLQFNRFNNSKSNIAWLEGTLAGGVSLVPSMEEWLKPGVVAYSNREEFADRLRALIAGEYDLLKMNAESNEYIREHLQLSKVNLKRKEVLLSLLDTP